MTKPAHRLCSRGSAGGLLGGMVGLCLVLLLAACGSSHAASRTTGSASYSRGIKLADCMRAHGVTSFPDPAGGGGGVNLDGTGIDPQAPAFKAAQRACASLEPGGAGGSEATESEFLGALEFAKCMRTHGFPSFPDPTRNDAPPGPILIVGHGFFFRVSQNFDPNTESAKRAMAACGGG